MRLVASSPRSLVSSSLARRVAAAILAVLPPMRAAALPDLVVESVDASTVARDCQTAEVSGSVSVVIRNDGMEAVIASATVLCFDDRDLDGAYSTQGDVILGQGWITPMAAFSQTTVAIELGGQLAFVGAPILAFVDSQNRVSEENEARNVQSSNAPALAPPCYEGTPPDFEVSRFENLFDEDISAKNTPLIGHLEDTNVDGKYDERDAPTLVFNAGAGQNYNVVSVRGTTGEWLHTSPESIVGTAGIAIGDLDEDGIPEVVATQSTPAGVKLVILDNNLNLKWTGGILRSPVPSYVTGGGGSPLIANI